MSLNNDLAEAAPQVAAKAVKKALPADPQKGGDYEACAERSQTAEFELNKADRPYDAREGVELDALEAAASRAPLPTLGAASISSKDQKDHLAGPDPIAAAEEVFNSVEFEAEQDDDDTPTGRIAPFLKPWCPRQQANLLGIPENIETSYLVNFVENLYDYRMFLPGEKDPEDIECLELLVDHGIDQEKAPEVLRLLKERFALTASHSSPPPEAEPSLTAKDFEAASSGKSKESRTVAGAPFEEFDAFAKANQWQTRRDRGLPWKTDVFQYIKDTYKYWISRGKTSGQPLTQADLKAADQLLYKRLQHDMSVLRAKGVAIPDFGVPAAKDAALIGLDPESARLLLASREQGRVGMATRRTLRQK